MQPQIERRSHAQRVPMDQGVVEVYFSEYGETAPADAVNIAEGGLSLRASILPEVGTEMRCAFPMPDGQSIEAECEVVWAQHTGPYAGEFGLRFVDIARLDEERIRDFVDAHQARARVEWDDSGAGDSDGGYVDDSDPGHEARVSDGYELGAEELPRRNKPPGMPDTIRLFIDGVGVPVAATVMHAMPDALIVAQELPFLKVGTHIAAVEDGPKGRLDSVELRLVNGVPRLMLTVLFSDEASKPGLQGSSTTSAKAGVPRDTSELSPALDTLPEREDAPLRLASESRAATAGAVSARRDIDSSATSRDMDARASRSPASRARISDGSTTVEGGLRGHDPHVATSLKDVDTDDIGDHDDLLGAAVHVRHRTAGAAADVVDNASREAEVGESPVDRLSFTLRTRVQALGERTKPLADRARELSKQGVHGIVPALRALVAYVMALANAIRQKAGPAAAALLTRARNTITHLRSGSAGSRSATPGRPVRRQQHFRASGTSRPAIAQAEVQTRLDPQRARRRALFLSSVAFVLVATTVWALTPNDDIADDNGESDTGSTESTMAVAPPSQPAVVSPYVEPVAALPQAAAPVPHPPEPSPVQTGPTPGPLAEPTYPSLGRERPHAPGSLASDSPYAEAAAEAEVERPTPEVRGSRTFGAASVANARSFEISMSQPVRTLVGRTEGNGFVVEIPGALATSGARTISRNHPMVARSFILNHGDHATLTIEFADGQSPAYRVSARGAALHIEIGR